MRKLRLLAGVSVAVLAASLFAGPANAAEEIAADSGRDPITAAVLAYKAAYPKISDDAAKVAATTQDARKELHNVLAKDAKTYGGGYFDAPTGITHVTLTNQDAAGRAAEAGRALGLVVEAHVVKYNYDELEQLADSVRAAKDELGKAANGRVGVEVSSNSVTVALTEEEAASLPKDAVPDWVTIVPASTEDVEEDVCTSRDNCNDSLRAGLVISRSGAGCSTGFMARFGGARWALTAGHCGAGNWSTAGTSIGPLAAVNALDSGPVDAGAIQVTNSKYAADTLGRIAISGSSWVPVKEWAHTMSFIWVGDVVCISARFAAPGTGFNPCGVVKNASDAANRGLVRYEGYDPCPGDSGGGVYWLPSSGNRFAYGLHSRSTTGCNTTPATAWFSALPRFWNGLSYDLA